MIIGFKICKSKKHVYRIGMRRCPECQKEKNKQWKQNNLSKVREKDRKWNESNKAHKKEYNKQWNLKNKDKVRNTNQEWYYKNAERTKKRKVLYYKANKTLLIAYQKQYRKNKLKYDNLFKVKTNIRILIRKAFTEYSFKKDSKTEKLLGCSYIEFYQHLISTAFKNYGSWSPFFDYHIDHIVPLCTANNVEEFVELNHYTNLQLLYPEDNKQKGSSLTWNLQKTTSSL